MRRFERYEVTYYVKPDGTCPFDAWHQGLRDSRAQAQIDKRIARLRLGNRGAFHVIKDSKIRGLFELILDIGPGYRIYCGDDGSELVVLCAGIKNTQAADIRRAKEYWKEYRS